MSLEERFFEKFYEDVGIVFGNKKNIALDKIKTLAYTMEISYEELLERYFTESTTKEKITNLLTVNETYFYRELRQIDVLLEKVAKNKKVRLLSAPCSNAAEVYTVLIRAQELGLDLDFEVVGVDINSEVVKRAKSGVYSQREVANINQAMLNRFFDIREEKYHIKKILNANVSFYEANIFSSFVRGLSQFDAILSRNMVIYFDEASKKKAVDLFVQLLNENGSLFMGHADNIKEPPLLQKNTQNGVVYYQKVLIVK